MAGSLPFRSDPMDNKIVLVIVAILIAAAAVAAFALSQNTEDTDKNFVT